MASILEFFEMYGTWFIVGAIIIVLAIIGRYADKTNFGQNQKDEKINKEDDTSSEQLIDTIIDQDAENKEESALDTLEQDKPEESSHLIQEESIDVENSKNDQEVISENHEKNSNINIKEAEDNINKENEYSFEEQYNALDEEINYLLPEKEVISEDLLDDIDSLSLDKTQKIKISDIPDLDDVDLPEIKNLNQQDDNIWKF